jgi:hypothetical protein
MSSILLTLVLTLIASQEPFHARRLGDRSPPPASLTSAAWLEGAWLGDGLGGVSEEVWSGPRGGVMMGMYRMLKDGKPVFYEFMQIVEADGTIALRLKHFSPDFSAWEDKSAFVTFRLVAVERDALHFDGLSFIKDGRDGLRIYLVLKDSKTGAVREEAFHLKRLQSGVQ